MDEKLGKSLDTILAQSSRHCLRYRLADYDFSSIPHADLQRLASSMLDYFEREMERLGGGNGAGGSASTGAGTGDAPPSNVTRRGRFRLR
jgi:hypothetical protein